MSDPADRPLPERPEVEAWREMVAGLAAAGEELAELTAALDERERADGYRALVRALGNHLGRFEVDRERPDLVPFNGWRQKMLMDNPDFRYWVADVRDDRRYRIAGTRGDAAYVSITAYAGRGGVSADASQRIDSDGLSFDADGRFEVVVGGDPVAGVDWLPLPAGSTAVWVRLFHLDVDHDRLGDCAIEPLDPGPPVAIIDPDRFPRHLARLGSAMAMMPGVFAHAAAVDRAEPNQLRHWEEMTGGAAFTEPGIHYVRGGWALDPGEALVIEGEITPCRYWNVLLYSRFLNSLDHRTRVVSRTGATATDRDGRFRLVLAAEDPRSPDHDWLDTEGRAVGTVVFRWLHAASAPALPTTRRCRLAELT